MKDIVTTSDVPDTIAIKLAKFAVDQDAGAIPDHVSERARLLMLDALGIALASTQYDYSHRTHAAIAELGATGTRRAIGYGTLLQPRDAALMNGFLIHGLDYDDTHSAGVIHATASVLPAALTTALEIGASGAEFQAAYIVGMEVATRLGSVAKGGFHQVGFHPTGVVGIFGAVAAIGRLRGLTIGQMVNAQGIALSMASGSLEFLQDGAWTKRIHPGWAASAAMTAVTMARHGFAGPSAVYEGRFGLFNTYLGESRAGGADLSLATAGLGHEWEVMNVAVKPLPACHFTHAVADAAVALHRAHAIPADQIAEVIALIPSEVVKTVCEPRSTKIAPQNSYDAQFSVPYAVASGLLRGRFSLPELEPAAFAAPEALDLMSRIRHEVDPNSRFPKYYSGEVVLRTKDGREFRHREDVNRGAAERPLSAEDITAKFIENAAMTFSAPRQVRLQHAILNVDQVGNLLALERMLAGRSD